MTKSFHTLQIHESEFNDSIENLSQKIHLVIQNSVNLFNYYVVNIVGKYQVQKHNVSTLLKKFKYIP